MKLFVNDIAVNIVDASLPLNHQAFDCIISRPGFLTMADLNDDVLLELAPTKVVAHVISLLINEKPPKKLDSVTFTVLDVNTVTEKVKAAFHILEAAGGIVRQNSKLLMIHRLGVWDLPKGKLEKGETPEEGAMREVEEECGVKVLLRSPVVSTWHTYIRGGKPYLKKTYWYAMDCTNDSQMQPQVEEDIDEVRWMTEEEAREALVGTYRSIRYIMRTYFKQEVN